MKEGSSYYPYYGYAYKRTDMEPKGPSVFTTSYQAVGDWLGKRQEHDYLLAPKPGTDDDTDDTVQV